MFFCVMQRSEHLGPGLGTVQNPECVFNPTHQHHVLLQKLLRAHGKAIRFLPLRSSFPPLALEVGERCWCVTARLGLSFLSMHQGIFLFKNPLTEGNLELVSRWAFEQTKGNAVDLNLNAPASW